MINGTPNTQLKHWAAGLVGKSWALGANGPDQFDCWGLVAFVQHLKYRREVPVLSVNRPDTDQWSTIRHLAQHSGWGKVESGLDGDVVLMSSRSGPHIGTLVLADGALGLLHAFGFRDVDGNDHGAVCFNPMSALPGMGYGRFEFWRHDAARTV